jgi:tRNA 5-methylaminomethyl-2-thiouridine biosynthesis bifunctional protein
MAEPPSPIYWRDDGFPGSSLYGDVYFSSQDGLAETRAVFLAGCGLPQAWKGRRSFTVGELGFGTGLNIAALLQLWRETKAPGARLSIFTIEAHPMSRQDAARALGHWPELGEAAQVLLDAWPGVARGFHRIDLPAFDAVLDIAILDAAEALDRWTGPADAWFLDGFAPSANPAMWSEERLAQVGRRSAPGARAATFTVAGVVRRGLAAAGFEVSKQPGFGRKKERLEARWPGEGVDAAVPPGPIAVIGAGIAGAGTVRAIRAIGGEARLFDALGPASGASGNPAALMTPRLDSGDGPPARLFAQAFRRAVQLYEAEPGAIIARGARHLATGPRDPPRFVRLADGDLFEPGSLVASADDIWMRDALVLEPAALVAAWAGAVETAAVARLDPAPDGGWRLLDEAGDLIAEAGAVVLCAGPGCATLVPDLPLQPVRGQVSLADGASIDGAVSFGAYAIPTRTGLLFGATHQKDRTDTAALADDHAANLEKLAEGLPDLAARLRDQPLTGRAAIRVATPDHLPLAGPVPDHPGLYVLSGLGGRGFCLAPLLAEHLAADLVVAPSPLPSDLAAAVDPGRFAVRAARRTSPRPPR